MSIISQKNQHVYLPEKTAKVLFFSHFTQRTNTWKAQTLESSVCFDIGL